MPIPGEPVVFGRLGVPGRKVSGPGCSSGFCGPGDQIAPGIRSVQESLLGAADPALGPGAILPPGVMYEDEDDGGGGAVHGAPAMSEEDSQVLSGGTAGLWLSEDDTIPPFIPLPVPFGGFPGFVPIPIGGLRKAVQAGKEALGALGESVKGVLEKTCVCFDVPGETFKGALLRTVREVTVVLTIVEDTGITIFMGQALVKARMDFCLQQWRVYELLQKFTRNCYGGGPDCKTYEYSRVLGETKDLRDMHYRWHRRTGSWYCTAVRTNYGERVAFLNESCTSDPTGVSTLATDAFTLGDWIRDEAAEIFGPEFPVVIGADTGAPTRGATPSSK